MTPDAIDHAAGLLADARRNGQRLDALPESCRPATLDDAHAIQEATALRLGDAIAGWKVGATPEGGVARGALLRSRTYASGARISAAIVPLLGIEAEIAFRLDRDLPARAREYDYSEVAGAVTALPAIEIVDSRFRGYPNAPLLDRIATLTAPGSWLGIDLVSRDALWSPLLQPWLEMCAYNGAVWRSGTNDPEELCAHHGWEAWVRQPGEEGADFGRWPFPVLPRGIPGIPRGFLVVARRFDGLRATLDQ